MEKKYQAIIKNNKIEFLEKTDFIKFEGKNVDIIVIHDKKRSIPQNNYYWGVILPIISEHIGENTETMHEVLKHKFLKKTKVLKGKNGIEEEIERIISTTRLSTKQMTQYIDAIKRWASEFLGLYIPDAGEVYISSNLTIN